MNDLAAALKKSIQRRSRLLTVTNALRLVNGAGDGLDGLLIDRYERHIQAQSISRQWQDCAEIILQALSSIMPVDYFIFKSRQGLDIKTKVLVGQASRTMVVENGIAFEVDLNDGLNCGLFLDMRRNRSLAAGQCKNKRVLNCFSYTCSFGVYARRYGAREAVNIDISRKILDRGKRNYQLNGFPTADGEFIKADSMAYLQRAFKKGNHFDVIILDPPSFARHEGRVFQVKRDLPDLIALSAAVLNPDGALLVTTNFSGISHADLERMLAGALNGRKVSSIQRVGQDEDFTRSNSFKESYLVGLWVKFL